MNTKTGEVLHTPPQNQEEIEEYLSNLEKYINIPELQDIDPILKMAVIHFQFESIHPFYDGNGRTGRMLNILYLTLAKKIDLPICVLEENLTSVVAQEEMGRVRVRDLKEKLDSESARVILENAIAIINRS